MNRSGQCSASERKVTKLPGRTGEVGVLVTAGGMDVAVCMVAWCGFHHAAKGSFGMAGINPYRGSNPGLVRERGAGESRSLPTVRLGFKTSEGEERRAASQRQRGGEQQLGVGRVYLRGPRGVFLPSEYLFHWPEVAPTLA